MINGSDNDDSFAKTICSICYEELKPIVEDLQSISICGHVFHELCLQQWFEYCSSTKKCTCPFCKQGCKANNVSRLYFQSIGHSGLTQTQRPSLARDEDPESLRREVRRLETKVIGLDSVVERQGKDLKELNQELCHCKEQEKKETILKDEALKGKALMEQLLRLKTKELDKSSLECSRFQERSMALAKELASIKLVSDLELDEVEVLKLASFGNGGNNQDTVDILRRSLVMRNRSYKELMVKCNALGRGESRSIQKLEKAQEKISRLKERVKELEITTEVKDNEVLRELKASKKTRLEWVNTNTVNFQPNFVASNKVPDDKGKLSSGPGLYVDSPGSLQDDPLSAINEQNLNIRDCPSTIAHNEDKNPCSSIDATMHRVPKSDTKLENGKDEVALESTPVMPNVTFSTKKEPSVCRNSNMAEVFNSKTNADKTTKISDVEIGDDVIVILDDHAQVKPTLNIRKESASPHPLSNPGDTCFSGGLLGPDGTNRYLGKWCRRGQNKETRQDLSASGTGDLISVGADGRGGRIKVLRSLNQSSMSMDSKETSTGTKRIKLGGKTNSQPSRGCLQIEHFFGRVSN